MKKLLFLSAIATITYVSNMYAQTWNFSTWNADATGDANNTSSTKDGLKIVGSTSGSTNMGIVDTNSTTWGPGTTGWNPTWGAEAEFTSTKRLKFGGSSQYSGELPTGRYLSFPVTEPTRIRVWFRQGGDSGRTLHISDGSNSLFSGGNTGNQNINYTEVTYGGNAGTIYIFCESNAFNIYKIEAVALSTLSVTNTKKQDTQVFSSGNKIFVSNIENKNTKVNIYSTSGQLVKSLKTINDTNIEINKKGVYFVNLQSEAGEKSVKVLIN